MLKYVAVVHERESRCRGLIKLHDQVGPSVANLNRVLPTLILKGRSSVVSRQNLKGGAVHVKGMVTSFNLLCGTGCIGMIADYPTACGADNLDVPQAQNLIREFWPAFLSCNVPLEDRCTSPDHQVQKSR